MDTIQITKRTQVESPKTDRHAFIASLKAVKKGQCVEYRGNMSLAAVQTILAGANMFLEKRLSSRKADKGVDIFCS